MPSVIWSWMMLDNEVIVRPMENSINGVSMTIL